MATVVQDKEAEMQRWRDNGFYVFSSDDPLLIYSVAVQAHKAAHRVLTTFWFARCHECEWEAKLMTWRGNPFDPMSNGQFAVCVEKTLYVPK